MMAMIMMMMCVSFVVIIISMMNVSEAKVFNNNNQNDDIDYDEENQSESTTTTTTTTDIVVLCLLCSIAWGMVSLLVAYIFSRIYPKTKRKRHQQQHEQLPQQQYCKGNIPYISYYLPQGQSYPLLGQIYNFLHQRPWDLLLQWHTLYGPIVSFVLLNDNMVSIANSPSLLRAILQSQVQHVRKDVTNTLKPFLSILGTGIVSSEGQHWLRQRLKMSHPLRFNVLQQIPKQTLWAVQFLMNQIENSDNYMNYPIDATTATKTNNRRKKNDGTATVIPLGTCLRHLTLQVISSTFLSLNAHESDHNFAKLYLPIVDESNARVWHPYRSYLPILPSWWMYHYNVYRLNKYVSTLIRTRWTLRYKERKIKDPNNVGREYDILDQVLQDLEEKEPVIASKEELPYSIINQVRDEMKTFMLAGHETSAAMMTWTIYELIRLQYEKTSSNNEKEATKTTTSMASTTTSNDYIDMNETTNGSTGSNKTLVNESTMNETDDANSVNNIGNNTSREMESSLKSLLSLVQDLYDEASTVFDPNIDWKNATYDQLPSIETFGQLILSESCLKESLRKYSVVPLVTRRTVQDMTILDDDTNIQYYIPRNTAILINIQSCHYNTKYWDNPHQYNPTRFLPQNVRIKPIEPYTFLPFIAGPRNCLGQHLALLESKIVISLLLQRYTFDFAMGHKHKWLTCTDPRHRYMVPIIPSEEIYVTVTRRCPTKTTSNGSIPLAQTHEQGQEQPSLKKQQ